MSILADLGKELGGMFWADARLTTSILLLVAGVGGLILAVRSDPLLGGGILLLGCLAILIEAAFREAKRRARR